MKKVGFCIFPPRHSHPLIGGHLADVDKPFRSELGPIMYPGDPTARSENAYNCSCTVAAKVISVNGTKIADRAAKADRSTAQNLYYKDPKEFDIKQKMLRNKASDKSLLAKYRAKFGKNAPKSLAKLQEMKYNSPAEWEAYKTYLRSIRSGELSALADFDLYQTTSRLIDKKLVGITTLNGIKITGKSNHFISRVIGSVQQRRSGVRIDDVLEALTNKSTTIFPVRTSLGMAKSQKFRSNWVEVSVNPDTGILIQTNPYT